MHLGMLLLQRLTWNDSTEAEINPTDTRSVPPMQVHKACRYVIACVKGNAQVRAL